MKYTNHFLATKLRSSAVVLFANIYRFQTDHLIHIFEIEIGTKSEIYFRIITRTIEKQTNEIKNICTWQWCESLHRATNERTSVTVAIIGPSIVATCCCCCCCVMLLFHYHWSMYCSLLCCYWLKMLIDFIFQIQRDITNLLLLLLFASNSATNRQAMPMNVTKSNKNKNKIWLFQYEKIKTTIEFSLNSSINNTNRCRWTIPNYYFSNKRK